MRRLAMCSQCGGFLPSAATRCPHCVASSKLDGFPKASDADSAKRPTTSSGEASALAGRVGENASNRRLERFLRLASGGAVAVTLMACYGAPPHSYRPKAADDPCSWAGDRDQDGSCAPADCDDNDPDVHPTAADPLGDGRDQNCDGQDGVATAVGAVAPIQRAVEPSRGKPVSEEED